MHINKLVNMHIQILVKMHVDILVNMRANILLPNKSWLISKLMYSYSMKLLFYKKVCMYVLRRELRDVTVGCSSQLKNCVNSG